MKTTAAVLHEIGKPLRIEELEIPKLAAGQLLVKMAYSGVCHSQLNEARGRRGEDKFLPHTMGHEGTGIVEEVGAGVSIPPGAHVIISWLKGNGADVASTKYGSDRTVNSGAVSTFLDYAVISENRATPIAEDLPLKEMALLGCAIPTGAGIICNKLGVGAGASVAVIGVGGIGASVILAARNAGATRIAAIDVNKAKLAQAVSFGATETIDAAGSDWTVPIKSGNAQGFDFVIESAGRVSAIEDAMAIARPFGGTVVVAGNPPFGDRAQIDPYDLIRGKILTGTWGGETRIAEDIERYIEWYRAGQLPLGEFISKVYTLSQVNEALDDLEKGLVLRAMLDMTGKL